MGEEVQILITSGVGIQGTIYVPGDIVSVTPGEAITIKASGRATDVPADQDPVPVGGKKLPPRPGIKKPALDE